MLKELFDLSGRAALVTGGSKGIGKAVARGYAEAGARVMIAARHQDQLERAAQEIGQGMEFAVETFSGDLAERASLKALAQAATERLGSVDILFNNAGSNEPQDLVDTTEQSWDRLVELNLTSCMLLARALAPGMIDRGWGRIVHTSSVMATRAP